MITNSSKAMTALACCVFGSVALGAEMSQQEYREAIKEIAAVHQQERAACKTLQGNAFDICQEKARGREHISRAELEERHHPSDHNRFQLSMARAEAEYGLAKQLCNKWSDQARVNCQDDARREFMLSKAEALITHHKTAAGSQLIGLQSDAQVAPPNESIPPCEPTRRHESRGCMHHDEPGRGHH